MIKSRSCQIAEAALRKLDEKSSMVICHLDGALGSADAMCGMDAEASELSSLFDLNYSLRD
jgi:hypothetical protein